jgi:hypothetical protein
MGKEKRIRAGIWEGDYAQGMIYVRMEMSQ